MRILLRSVPGVVLFGGLLISGNSAYADTSNFARRIGEAMLDTQSHEQSRSTTTTAWTALSYGTYDFTSPYSDHDFHQGQLVAGISRQWGRWTGGIALSYAREATADNGAFFHSDSTFDEPALAGYAGYRLNDTFAVSAIIGYEYGHAEYSSAWSGRFGNTFSSTFEENYSIPFSDIALNATYRWTNWSFKGRAGHRFNYAITDNRFDDSYRNIVYGFGEVGYQLSNWQPFFRTRIEKQIYGSGYDVTFAYIGAGVNYQISPMFNLGVVYERELNYEFSVQNQAIVNMSMNF